MRYLPADNLARCVLAPPFNRRRGSVSPTAIRTGEPFQLSTAAIYQQLQQPLAQQTLPDPSSLAAERAGVAISGGRNSSHEPYCDRI